MRFSDEYSRLYSLNVDNYHRDDSTGSIYAATTRDTETFTYEEILRHAAREEWIRAAMNEIEQLEAHDTWIVEDIANAKSKILPGTWTFKLKRRPDGSVKKYKARFCVRGDLQNGVDETFAPVVGFTSVRIFLVFALLMGWVACTIDFVNAFVQAALSSPVWIHLTRGFRSKKGQRTSQEKPLWAQDRSQAMASSPSFCSS